MANRNGLGHPTHAERYTIRVFYSEPDKGFVATAPAFGTLRAPGALSTLGRTRSAALREMEGLLETVMVMHQEDGIEPPEPSGRP